MGCEGVLEEAREMRGREALEMGIREERPWKWEMGDKSLENEGITVL